MQQSNIYIIGYTAAVTMVCAIALALAATLLKPRQDKNIELERMSNILSTVMTLKDGDNVQEIYSSRVTEYVVNHEGQKVDNVKATDIVVANEAKKPVEERLLPVYEIGGSADKSKVEFYVFPIYGRGLWDDIWGYVAFGSDLTNLKGTKFDHKAETPGLGARIATDEIQSRYEGKSIFDENNQLVPVAMQKGENGGGEASKAAYASNPHQVDGMSGATITAKGLNAMLETYLNAYSSFIKSKKTSQNLSLN